MRKGDRGGARRGRELGLGREGAAFNGLRGRLPPSKPSNPPPAIPSPMTPAAPDPDPGPADDAPPGPVVLSLGGSVLGQDLPEGKRVARYVELLDAAADAGPLYVVVGGGGAARHFIAQARDLGADEGLLDEIGIAVTRLNAALLIAALGEGACPFVPEDFDVALTAQGRYNPVVMGGTHPGHTTDGVAAMLAERARARLVIATNVDGVYTGDPASDEDAELIDELDHARLEEIALGQAAHAGASGPVDPLAARVIVRSRLRACVVNGNDLGTLEAALSGGDFRGTRIRST